MYIHTYISVAILAQCAPDTPNLNTVRHRPQHAFGHCVVWSLSVHNALQPKGSLHLESPRLRVVLILVKRVTSSESCPAGWCEALELRWSLQPTWSLHLWSCWLLCGHRRWGLGWQGTSSGSPRLRVVLMSALPSVLTLVKRVTSSSFGSREIFLNPFFLVQLI